MSTVVCGVKQQQCRRQDVAVGIPVSAHGDHGTINFNYYLFWSIFQFMGCKEILVQHIVELLSTVYCTISPGQVSCERVQPRQHLESTRLLCSHWYVYMIYCSLVSISDICIVCTCINMYAYIVHCSKIWDC